MYPLPFFFKSNGDNRDLHSFPTRRSSDLPAVERLFLLGQLEHRGGVAPGYVAGFRHGVPPPRWRDRSARDVSSQDRKSTRLNSSHRCISYAVFCLKKKRTASPCKGRRPGN